ncbi:MAG: hypothetical protein WC693_01040 [Patescibacteria group bacterium]|jgi:hypothetical protein
MFFATVVADTGSWVANFDWSEPTWDLFIILFFVIAALLYGMSLGRDRIIVILISIYMAMAVINTAPFLGDTTGEIGVNQFFVVKITAFVAVFVALFFMLSRSALISTVASSDERGKWWQVIVFSIMHVGLLISITLSFLPKSALDGLAPLTKTLFTLEISQFIWVLAPILLMIMIKGGAAAKKRYKYDI